MASQYIQYGHGGTNSFPSIILNGATSGSITMQAPATVTSYSLTWPDAQGGANTFLKNNGSGVLSWAAGAGGVDTLAAVGSSPNANGASISSTTLTLQPADSTNPGVVTAGTQTFGGAKTFAETVSLSKYLALGASNVTTGYQIEVVGAASGGTTQVGVGSTPLMTTAATSNNIAFYARATSPNSSFTTGFACSFFSNGMGKGASNTVTRYAAFYANPTTTISSNNAILTDDTDTYAGHWGIFLENQRLHLLAGNVAIGQSSALTTTNHALRVRNDSLTNDQQHSIRTDTVFNSAATTYGYGVEADVSTANSAFTMAVLASFRAGNVAKGAASTITRRFQFYGDTPTGAGTANVFLADNETASSDHFIHSTSTSPSLFSGIVNASAGVRTKYATTDTENPPTQAQLVTAFGAAATNGTGFLGVLNDNGGGSNVYFVFSDGTNYFYVLGTVGA